MQGDQHLGPGRPAIHGDVIGSPFDRRHTIARRDPGMHPPRAGIVIFDEAAGLGHHGLCRMPAVARGIEGQLAAVKGIVAGNIVARRRARKDVEIDQPACVPLRRQAAQHAALNVLDVALAGQAEDAVAMQYRIDQGCARIACGRRGDTGGGRCIGRCLIGKAGAGGRRGAGRQQDRQQAGEEEPNNHATLSIDTLPDGTLAGDSRSWEGFSIQ